MTSPAEPAIAGGALAGTAGGVLTIDLAAIVDNWRDLGRRAAPSRCAAVVKADAYGLGAAPVAAALARAGCTTFFVATVDEGIALRAALAPHVDHDRPPATIFLLNGPLPGATDAILAAGLTPVLNSLDDVERWSAAARQRQTVLPAALHLDTGMSRLGLTAGDAARLTEDSTPLEGLALDLVMSHLAVAECPGEAMNERQRLAFRDRAARLPAAALSLANSSGIFLGPAYHYDVVRPGAALFGVQPRREPGATGPMRPVIRLRGRILQVREIDTPETVGYGATYHARGRQRIATVGVGYADGYLRSLSNRSFGYLDGMRVPLVGRVSMDLVTFDVSAVPAAAAVPGAGIDLIGPDNPVDDVADWAGTIGYEILTALGRRYHRVYHGGEGASR